MYVGLAKAAQHFGVSPRTMVRWCEDQKVEYIRTKGNFRRIRIDSETSRQPPPPQKSTVTASVVYCRVSSPKQKDDLERQILAMADQFPGHELVKDIGSGLNFKRKGLLSILERAERGELREVVVASKDRLCRFGFEFIEWLLEKHAVKLLVLEHQDKSPEQEFTEDILAIMQVFSCRWNGKRNLRPNKNNNSKIAISNQCSGQASSPKVE